jgi:hypothetical protein
MQSTLASLWKDGQAAKLPTRHLRSTRDTRQQETLLAWLTPFTQFRLGGGVRELPGPKASRSTCTDCAGEIRRCGGSRAFWDTTTRSMLLFKRGQGTLSESNGPQLLTGREQFGRRRFQDHDVRHVQGERPAVARLEPQNSAPATAPPMFLAERRSGHAFRALGTPPVRYWHSLRSVLCARLVTTATGLSSTADDCRDHGFRGLRIHSARRLTQSPAAHSVTQPGGHQPTRDAHTARPVWRSTWPARSIRRRSVSTSREQPSCRWCSWWCSWQWPTLDDRSRQDDGRKQRRRPDALIEMGQFELSTELILRRPAGLSLALRRANPRR